MKQNKKLLKMLSSMFIFVCAFFLAATSTAKAWTDTTSGLDKAYKRINYYIHSAKKSGEYFHIDGYAYNILYQNYTATNHDYYIKVVGSDGTSKQFSATKKQQSEDLTTLHKIEGALTCDLVHDRSKNDTVGKSTTGQCNVIIDYAGFSADIPLSYFKADVTYTFWIQIKEYSGGTREWESHIISPQTSMAAFEYNHIDYSITSSFNDSKFKVLGNSVLMRKGPNKTSTWSITEPPFSTTHAKHTKYGSPRGYWDYGVTYTHLYQIVSNSTGIWIEAGFSTSTDNVAHDGTAAKAWVGYDYVEMGGKFLTLQTKSKSYLGDIRIETKTAKVGDKATIKAGIENKLASGQNPMRVQILVDGSSVYDSGTQNWSGMKTFSVDINAASYNRSVKVVVTETLANIKTDLTSTLYASSNQTNTSSSVSGSVQGNNPIYVIKTRSSETKYYETIKYNQFSTYYALDDDNILRKKVQVDYSTNYSAITTWDSNDISASSYVSSPVSTSSMTATTRTSTRAVFENTKTITYTNLSQKDTSTTVSGLGVNNITLKLNAKYQFIDAADISVIDSRTHEKGDKGEIYVTIHTDKMRTMKYKIYFDGVLLQEGTDTWNGNKNFTLDPVVTDPGKVRVEIVQPNTIPENLEGEVHIASREEVHINRNGSFTPSTPVRVVTTPSSVKRYYETITLDSGSRSDNTIPAGACVDNDLTLRYSTTENTIGLNSSEISARSYYPSQDAGLNYTKQNDGTYLVPQLTSGNSSTLNSTLPNYYLDKFTGTVYDADSIPADVEILDGGKCWYVPMDTPEGNYDYTTHFDRVGVNKVDVILDNDYTVEGSLLGNTNSLYKIIRVKNPATPNFTWHKTYSLSELLETFNVH